MIYTLIYDNFYIPLFYFNCMDLQYKIFESSSPLDLQNEVNINFLMGEEHKGRDIEIVSQSYFVETDGDRKRHYLSIFYKSSPKSESS